MAFELDFTLSGKWNVNLPSSFENADEMELRYEYFLGDIKIKDNVEKDLSALWGWIPILDFGMSLFISLRHLDASAEESFIDFTESDDKIKLTKNDSVIHISCTYSDSVITIQYIDFKHQTGRFLQKLADDLSYKYPSVLKNAFVKHVFDEWNSFFTKTANKEG